MIPRPLRILAFAALLLAAPAQGAVLVSDFSAFSTQLLPPMNLSWTNATIDQFVQDVDFISIAPVLGGDPSGDGYFTASLTGGPSDFTGLTRLSLEARVDPGNESGIVKISFLDSGLALVASATFPASSFNPGFTTQETGLSFTGPGSRSDVAYWRIEGNGVPSDAFRYSFGNLVVAVPEPSTRLLVSLAMGAFLVSRRRRWISRQAPAASA